jgi:hypothetical protein
MVDHLDLGENLPDLAELSNFDFSLNDTVTGVPKPVFNNATRRNPIPFKTVKSAAKTATAALIDNETSAVQFLSLCSVSDIFSGQSYKLMRYIALRSANLTSMGQQAQLSSTRDDPHTDVERNLITYMVQLQPVGNQYWAEIG